GPKSGDTIFDANTLSLELTYLHRPLLPGLRSLLKTLALARGSDGAGSAMAKAGLLPLRQHISLEMQSSAYQWPNHASLTQPQTPSRSAHARPRPGGTSEAGRPDVAPPGSLVETTPGGSGVNTPYDGFDPRNPFCSGLHCDDTSLPQSPSAEV